MTFDITDKQALQSVCEHLLAIFPNGGVVLLRGTLGSGKTTLVKQMVLHLGALEGATSPTFAIMHTYDHTRVAVHHYDIYRIGSEEFMNRGLAHELEVEGFHFVEWGDDCLATLLAQSGIAYLDLSFTLDGDQRTLKVNDAHA